MNDLKLALVTLAAAVKAAQSKLGRRWLLKRAFYYNRLFVIIPLLLTRCFQGEKFIKKELFNLVGVLKKPHLFAELWATLYMYFTKIIIIHIFMTKTHDSWFPYSCPSSIYLLMAPLLMPLLYLPAHGSPYSCLSSYYQRRPPFLMSLLFLPAHGSLTHAPPSSTCSWLSYSCSYSIYLLMALLPAHSSALFRLFYLPAHGSALFRLFYL